MKTLAALLFPVLRYGCASGPDLEDRTNNGYPEQAPGIGPVSPNAPVHTFRNALGVNVQRSSSNTATQPRRKPTPLISRFAGRLP
jgi:hypothetical protein